MHYILDENREPKKVDLHEWAAWLENADRTVKQEHCVDSEGNRFYVSTVFLGLDHSFEMKTEPELFETILFSKDALLGEVDWGELECVRCATWEQAEDLHEGIKREWNLTVEEEEIEI